MPAASARPRSCSARPVPSLRALGVLACLLCSLTLTACAATVPWPPPGGSCVEAYKRPGRHQVTRYWINDRPATYEEVARTVYDTPALRAKVHRGEVVAVAGPVLVGSGQVGWVSGMLAAAARGNPLFALIAIPGVAALVTGVILMSTTEDPFRGAVVAFNEEARRRGVCGDSPWPAPRPAEPSSSQPPFVESEPSPAPREGLPVLPSRGWTP
jgi:hypothetical protein